MPDANEPCELSDVTSNFDPPDVDWSDEIENRRSRCCGLPSTTVALTVAASLVVLATLAVYATARETAHGAGALQWPLPDWVGMEPPHTTNDDFVRPQRFALNGTVLEMDLTRGRWASRGPGTLTILMDANTGELTYQMAMGAARMGTLCLAPPPQPNATHEYIVSASRTWGTVRLMHERVERDKTLEVLRVTPAPRPDDFVEEDHHVLERDVRFHNWQSWDGVPVRDHQYDTLFATDARWRAALALCGPRRVARPAYALEQVLEEQGVPSSDVQRVLLALARTPVTEQALNGTALWKLGPLAFFPCDWFQQQVQVDAVLRQLYPCLRLVVNETRWIVDTRTWIPRPASVSYWTLVLHRRRDTPAQTSPP